MAHPVRRNIAHLSAAERDAYIAAILQADLHAFADGVSYWDKQDQVHQSTHNHGGNSFLPWHREFVNRYEALLQQSNPDVAAHYWDWTEDPTATSDGQGGTVDLSVAALMGTMNGQLNGVLAALHNGGALPGSREDTGNPASPPQSVTRSKAAGAPGIAADDAIISSADAFAPATQWQQFRQAVEGAHNTVHGYIGGDIGGQHQAFEDPFVFLLHSNVDRLFAMWQTRPGLDWRLDPNQVYGDQSNTADDEGILHNLQPWDGTVQFGAPIEPWTGSSPLIEVKNCRHPSVVRPPCYDTLPLTVAQAAPLPGDSVNFISVVEFLPTARAVRLLVRGCRQVTATATVTAPFTLLSATVASPEPDGFESTDLLVWVLFSPGAAGTTASGTVTVTVADTGDVFTIPITATVIPNPTVGSSLVLDTSGSMSAPSGLPGKDRMAVLHDAAPLFVSLLDTTDGIGIARFDTDATPVAGVQDSGPMIGGAGRAAALGAITGTVTNPAGLTAIGDGLETAAAQLAAVAGTYDTTATVVFTDGHETADKTIAAAASSVNSRVFAIGLGTPDQLNPGALGDIADGTGGFLLLTGNQGPADQLRLQKYFAQVLAGVTNAEIVVDPNGHIPVGGKIAIPFELTAADIRADVIVLGDTAPAIRLRLEAPDGHSVDASTAGVEALVESSYQLLRLSPTVVAPLAPAGTWQAILSVDKRRLESWRRRLRKLLSGDDQRTRSILDQVLRSVETHGVPFSLTVQARSALHMAVQLTQSSRRPGRDGQLTVTLTDSGIPLIASAAVVADVTAPTGATHRAHLHPHGDSYRTTITTTGAGTYHVHVQAAGSDLRGVAFTREALRSLAVWSRGDDTPPTTIEPSGHGADLCDVLRCLLGIDGVEAALRRHDLDPAAIAKCLEGVCG